MPPPVGGNHAYVQFTVSQKKFSDGKTGDTVYISVMGTDGIKKSTDSIPCLYKEKGEVKVMKSVHSFVWVATNSIPCDSNIPPYYDNVNKINIKIKDVTEGNRFSKYEQLEKCLGGGTPEYVPADSTPRLGTISIRLKDRSGGRVKKALRAVAMSLSVPLKAAKGESFFVKEFCFV